MQMMQTLPSPRRKTLLGLSGRAKIVLGAAAVALLALVGLSVDTLFNAPNSPSLMSSKRAPAQTEAAASRQAKAGFGPADASPGKTPRRSQPSALGSDWTPGDGGGDALNSKPLAPVQGNASLANSPPGPKDAEKTGEPLDSSLSSSWAARNDGKPASKWYEDLAKKDPSNSYYSLVRPSPPMPARNLPSLAPPAPAGKPSDGVEGGDGNKVDAPKDKPTAKTSPAKADSPQTKPIESQPKPPPEQSSRKVIYTAELEFEVDSFDAAVAIIMQLNNATKGSFLGTINQDKLPNGKMRGVVVLRVPPDLLTDLIGKLIKELTNKGELKNQNLHSSDVSKLYTDLESRLKAARSMEERLIGIIKEGKGVIKDLLQAEKELGIWRTKIEEFEGELRYYANLVAHSTLTIKLYERDIRTQARVTENERIQAGIETEEVEKAFNDLKTLAQKKGT